MDVSFLRPVLDAPGPYATVCADVTHTTENADTELDLKVRAVAEQLEQQGAPAPVIEAVRGRLLEGNDGGEAGTLRGRAVVVAADGSVVLDQPLVDVPRQPVAEWAPQPDLLPVLGQLPGGAAHRRPRRPHRCRHHRLGGAGADDRGAGGRGRHL